MLRSVFTKTIWDQRRSLIWWAIGIILLALYTAGLYPYIATPAFDQYLSQLPEAVLALLGGSFGLSTIEAYLHSYFFVMMGPLIFAIYAIAAGSGAIAGEEEKGTLDLLLANPVPRWRVVVEKFAAMFVGTMILAFFLWFGLALTVAFINVELDLWLLAQACVSSALAGFSFGALALALGGLRGSRGLSIGVTVGATIIAYLLDSYTSLVKEIEPYKVLSPFYYGSNARPIFNGLDLSHAAVLVAVSLVCAAIAVVAFERRDVAV